MTRDCYIRIKRLVLFKYLGLFKRKRDFSSEQCMSLDIILKVSILSEAIMDDKIVGIPNVSLMADNYGHI